MTTLRIGTKLEDYAVEYLQEAGINILHRNFRCKLGEIDLIVRDDATLVFVEVRYRQNDSYGNAAETVNLDKQRKIINAAQFYLQTRSWAANLACRFDVIAMGKSQEMPQINWIKDAFHV